MHNWIKFLEIVTLRMDCFPQLNQQDWTITNKQRCWKQFWARLGIDWFFFLFDCNKTLKFFHFKSSLSHNQCLLIRRLLIRTLSIGILHIVVYTSSQRLACSYITCIRNFRDKQQPAGDWHWIFLRSTWATTPKYGKGSYILTVVCDNV